MKKIVKLTESQLHKVIKESVSQILNEMVDEGQGLNYLRTAFSSNPIKKSRNRTNDTNILGFQYNTPDGDEISAKEKYINTGIDPFGKDDDEFYDEMGFSMSTPETAQGRPAKKINKGSMGKLGRRAALNTVRAFDKTVDAVDKMLGKGNYNKKYS